MTVKTRGPGIHCNSKTAHSTWEKRLQTQIIVLKSIARTTIIKKDIIYTYLSANF